MASSIVLTGSLAGITGLDHRLVTELKAALTTPSYAAIAHLRPVIRVSHSSFPSNTIPWVGGSLYAAMIK